MAARYLVGIDLGTTNSACAYVEPQRSRRVRTFDVPQLTGLGRVASQPTLPSFVYLAGRHDVPAGSLYLPWADGRDHCVGLLAREQGARVPGRLVGSAKSWLCHGGVDRTAAILPWGGEVEVDKISPVEASVRILSHLVEAWAHGMGVPLGEQDIVLTVPASFDAVARQLTLQAAREAGLGEVVLIEEPQAAFYAWLARHEDDWRARIAEHPLVLVVDVGGGTTDFSLIAATHGRSEVGVERLAVGDHLLLGGDNMDIALARHVESEVGAGQLDAGRFHGLVGQCRAAKEDILADETVREVAVIVPGRGGRVVGGALSGRVTRELVLRTVLDGFFPAVDAVGPAPERGRAGMREFGLPYASDPAVTRHVADFLARQRETAGQADRDLVRPDAILFNGGACEPAVVRARVAEVVGHWHVPDGSWRPAVLDSESLQLAVARGAAYFGLARRGQGVRIGSGTARTYYLGLDAPTPDAPTPDAPDPDAQSVLCLVPRGMDEGDSVRLARDFELLANQPVAFPLFTATDRSGEHAGEVVTVAPGTLQALPPIRTVLRYGRKLDEQVLPVALEVRLSEIGTLEVWCAATRSEHRWRLEFTLRDAPDGPRPGESAGLVVEAERLERVVGSLREVFEDDGDPVRLTRRLEEGLDASRDAWPLETVRTMWDALWSLEPGRARSPAHEARWLNLAGFLLRPGFGDPGDELRVSRLWRVLGHDLRHPRAVQGRAELWNLWKRVAGGLSDVQQEHLLREVSFPLLRKGKPSGTKPGPQEVREMWQAVGSCERLPAARRADMARTLARAAERGKASDQELWALARIAARVPVYGPLNCLVPRSVATEVAERLLAARTWTRPEGHAFALAQAARRTGDRERDLDEALRERVAGRLDAEPGGRRLATMVREVTALEASDQARLLDESLPAGLRLREAV
jgi:molecular chaperone DnaK (HSP70)